MVQRAALEYGVPKSTLHDQDVMPGAVGGAPRYLDDEEEEELVRWSEGCAEIGCAKNVKEVRAIVGAIVAKKENLDSVTVSHRWWDRFRARLTMRAGESLAYVRANRQTLDHYFENDLTSKPGRISTWTSLGSPFSIDQASE